MINQFRVERYKLLRSILFWFLLILIIVAGVSYGIGLDTKHHITDVRFAFYDAIPDVSLFFIQALFTSWFIGGDFSSRTIHHEITSGSSRASIILTRAVPVIIATLFLHISEIFSGAFALGTHIGFDTFKLSADTIPWIGTVLVQFIALECFFVLISFICCNLYIGLVATIIAEFTMCNIARNYLGDLAWYKYSFFHLVEDPKSTELGIYFIVAVLSIAGLMFLTYLVFRKREI